MFRGILVIVPNQDEPVDIYERLSVAIQRCTQDSVAFVQEANENGRIIRVSNERCVQLNEFYEPDCETGR